MHKGPIWAIIVSVIAIVSIYFLTDIKENQDIQAINKVIDSNDNETISRFLESIDEEDRNTALSLFEEAKSSQNSAALDALIAFYEERQQYNFAAYYHTLKAEIKPTASNWEVAGDRQISVSSNAAYDVSFNEMLYEEGLKSYQKAIALDSSNLELQVKLGSAIVDKSPQPMQGISLLLGVIEQDSMHVNGNLTLGKFGIISGQYDKAVIRLEKVLSLQPENAEALFLTGEAYSNLGLNEKAISCFSKCKEIVENEDLKKEIDAYLQQLL